MVVGRTDDQSCILIGRSKYLTVQIFTFDVQILGNICIQIGNICTFTYLYVIFGGRKMTFCKYHIHIFRIFDIWWVVRLSLTLAMPSASGRMSPSFDLPIILHFFGAPRVSVSVSEHLTLLARTNSTMLALVISLPPASSACGETFCSWCNRSHLVFSFQETTSLRRLIV
jgi:hypothetical protein